MPTFADYLRAANAPPIMGELSAATTQPWLVPGIGTGPGAQLIQKDPAGVLAAATAQAAAAGPANRYAGKVWGDTPGQAQGNLLNLRAQDLNAAAQAAARAQQAQQFNVQQQRLQDSARESAAWRQAEVEQRKRNDTLDFLSQLARLDTSTGQARYDTDVARATAAQENNAQRAAQIAALNGELSTARGSYAAARSGMDTAQSLFKQAERGGGSLAGTLVPGGMTPVVQGGTPDWEAIGGLAQNEYLTQEEASRQLNAQIQDLNKSYNLVPRERTVPVVRPPSGGMNRDTLAALLAAAGIGGQTTRQQYAPGFNAPRPLLVPGWNGSAASDPRYARPVAAPAPLPSYDRTFSVDEGGYSPDFSPAPVTAQPVTPNSTFSRLRMALSDMLYPPDATDREWRARPDVDQYGHLRTPVSAADHAATEAEVASRGVTRMQMLPDGSLVPQPTAAPTIASLTDYLTQQYGQRLPAKTAFGTKALVGTRPWTESEGAQYASNELARILALMQEPAYRPNAGASNQAQTLYRLLSSLYE